MPVAQNQGSVKKNYLTNYNYLLFYLQPCQKYIPSHPHAVGKRTFLLQRPQFVFFDQAGKLGPRHFKCNRGMGNIAPGLLEGLPH